MKEMNPPDDWLKTGWTRDSQTRTRLVDSLFCITCSLENNAFCLHYVIKVTLHYLMLHRFKIHSVSELSCTALLDCRALQPRVFARLLVDNYYELLTLLFEFSKILSWFVHSIRLLDPPGIAIKLSVSQFLKQEELKTQKSKEKSREKSGQERAGPKALFPQRWQNRNSEQFKWFFVSVNEV